MTLKSCNQEDFRKAVSNGSEAEVRVNGVERRGFLLDKKFYFVSLSGKWELSDFGFYKIIREKSL